MRDDSAVSRFPFIKKLLWHQFLLLVLMKTLLGHRSEQENKNLLKTPVSITSDEEACMTDTSTLLREIPVVGPAKSSKFHGLLYQ